MYFYAAYTYLLLTIKQRIATISLNDCPSWRFERKEAFWSFNMSPAVTQEWHSPPPGGAVEAFLYDSGAADSRLIYLLTDYDALSF